MDGYSSAQVCRLADVTYRQLDYWTRAGLLTPSITAADGSGTRRRWSATDVARVKRIRLAAQLCNRSLDEAIAHLDQLEAELVGLAEPVLVAV